MEFGKYAFKPVTRTIRAAHSQSWKLGLMLSRLQFIDFLISKYIESDFRELGEGKPETLLDVEYADVLNAVKILGYGEVSNA